MKTIDRIKLHLLGELLHLANSHPPFLQKREFYQMKDHILRQYGQADGFEVQHIRKECWACEGTGKDPATFHSFGVEWHPKPCRRCNGTKIYEEFWTHLLRFKIGRHIFHLPEKRYYTEPCQELQRPVIKSFIRHEVPEYYLADEAFFWLTLFFDRDLFSKSFGHFGMPSRKISPLVILANLVWNIRRKSCAGKIRFPDPKSAQRAATSHEYTHGLWMRPYPCKFCGGYHIGHPSKKIKQKILSSMEGKA